VVWITPSAKDLQVIQLFDTIRIGSLNVLSWISTLAVLQLAADLLQVAALLGSITVSIFSVRWIMKQSRHLDRANKEKKANKAE
jgi:hypothetical protein